MREPYSPLHLRVLRLVMPLFILAAAPGMGQLTVEIANDPWNDTAQVAGTLHDLWDVEAAADDQHLVVKILFAQAVQPHGAGGSGELLGYLDLDYDRDGATGFQAFGEFVGLGTVGLGVEGWIDFSSYSAATGEMTLMHGATGSGTPVVADFFQANGLELEIPLSALGGGHGDVGLSIVAGNNQGAWTDMVPNSEHLIGLGNHQTQFGGQVVVEMEFVDPSTGQPVLARPNRTGDMDSLWWFYVPEVADHWVKVIEGCLLNQFWWVFHTGLNDLDLTIRASHVRTGQVATYQKSGLASPVIDQRALACP